MILHAYGYCMEEIKYNRANPRYRSGQFYKNNKYGFIIQLVTNKCTFGKWVFRVVRGEIPPNLRPENAQFIMGFDGTVILQKNSGGKPERLYQYGTDALRQGYTLISGKGAEVLFGIKNRN